MIGDATATLLAGAGTATVATFATLVKWVYETKKSAQETHRLLVGSDEIEGDGVIEIVEENRTISQANREAIRRADSVPSPRKYE